MAATDSPLNRLLLGGLISLLVWSTIIFGGAGPWGQSGTTVLGGALIFLWAWRCASEGEIRWVRTPLDLPLLAFAAVVLIQLAIGFPWGWTAAAPEQLLADAAARPGRLPLLPGTLDYHATREAFALFLVYCAAYYGVIQSVRSRPQLTRLLTAVCGLAILVAFYGLVEFLSGNHGILGWKINRVARVRGTFINSDHFAAYLAMAIPVIAGFLLALGARRRRRRRSHGGSASANDGPAAGAGADHGPQTMDDKSSAHSSCSDGPSSGFRSYGPSSSSDPPATFNLQPSTASPSANPQSAIRNPQSLPLSADSADYADSSPSNSKFEIRNSKSTASLLDRRHGRSLDDRHSKQLAFSFGCALAVGALAFTMSRGGILGALVGALVFVVLLWIREPGHRRELGAAGAALALAAAAVWAALEPLLERFGAIDLSSDARLRLYQDAAGMIPDFPILGAGLGAFERAFQKYVSADFATNLLVRHAHSEPLQLLAEAGIIGLLITLLAVALFYRELLLRRLLGINFESSNPELRNSQASSGFSNSKFEIRNSKSLPLSADYADSADSSSANSKFEIRNSKSVPSSNSKFEIRNSKSQHIRHDPYNIAIAFASLSALAAVAVHSLLDFPFRTPANTILLALILGIGVVAVGIRLYPDGAEPLLPTTGISLAGRRKTFVVLAAAALALFMAWTPVARLLAEQVRARGVEIIAGQGEGPERSDRPWVVETAKNREAMERLALAARLDPLAPEGHYWLGRLHEQLALRAWNAGLSEEGRFMPDTIARAEAALASLDAAERDYARAIRLAPGYAEAWGRLGWAYGIRAQIAPQHPANVESGPGQVKLALAGMHQAIALNPNNRYRHEVLAAYGFGRLEAQEATGRRGDFGDPVVQDALKAERRAVELDPAYLPDALARILRHSEATEQIARIVPEQAPDNLFTARLLEEQELWPQARAFFQRAIALAPDDGKPLYYREYAEALTRHGENSEAAEILQVVIRFDPRNLDLRVALAESHRRLKRPVEALAAYQEALDLANALAKDFRPAATPSAAPRSLVGVPRDDRMLDLVRQRFPPEVRTADPLSKALGALAGFHREQGRHELAVPLWEKAIQRAPDDAPTAFGLARSYDAVGAWVSAVDYYKRAIELNRGNLEYRLTLADRYYQNDMTYQAINLWREVVAVRPTLVAVRLKLASAYVKLEQFPHALREYEKVLQLEPRNPDVRRGLMLLRGKPAA